MPALKHVHKYERVEVGKNGWVVYRCVLPGCSHYLPTAELIVNRESMCHGVCNGIVIYTQDDYNQKLKRPMCSNCRALRKEQRAALQTVPEIELNSEEDY